MKPWTLAVVMGIAMALVSSSVVQAEDASVATEAESLAADAIELGVEAEPMPAELAADAAEIVAGASESEETASAVVEPAMDVLEVAPATELAGAETSEETAAAQDAELVEAADLADDSVEIAADEAADAWAPADTSADAWTVTDEMVAEEAVAEEILTEGVVDEAAAYAEAESLSVVSGSAGRDANGKHGSIHVVQRGDTLWAISDQYLKTPWVWPAIWNENEDIANPHRIYPGDHIWISDTEMRRVTPAEAADLVAAVDIPVEVVPAAPMDEAPLPLFEEAPAAMDEGTIAIAPEPAAGALRTLAIPARGNMSFVSPETLEAASSIVDSPSARIWLSQGNQVVLGLGEGETEVGSRYDVFDDAEPVRDNETGKHHGYHVRVLGWLEVTAVHGDTSTGEIRVSPSEIARGARIIPREPMPVEVGLIEAPADVEGKIIYLPSDRTQMAMLDYVYINRGSVHGLEAGSRLEVYEAGELARDEVRGRSVRVPDHRVGDMVIVKVKATSAVGFVMHSTRELGVGDVVRSRAPSVAMR